jgi:hypothetical protein
MRPIYKEPEEEEDEINKTKEGYSVLRRAVSLNYGYSEG